MAIAGYDCAVWMMGHILSDDGVKNCITVFGLEKSRITGEQGDDSVHQCFQGVWMSCSVIRINQCQDSFRLDINRSGSLARQVF